MQYVFRPLPRWPYPVTNPRRSRYAFKATWGSTLRLLDRELRMLNASDLVIGADFREQDLRLDGLPRSNARVPEHPGVELSFDTREHGRLVYATDTSEWWEHNVRQIALGLESLRAVDRYGITRRGEQYAGFRQLETAGAKVTRLRGELLIRKHGGYRQALAATHPDAGGDHDDFLSVQAARG
jgi:hypothetical protein